MRRKDREMPPEFALTVADKCEYAVISMTDISGEPYCVPVTIARDGNAVYFHSAKEGQKITALRATEFESAIIRGNACEVTDDSEKIHALRLICQRHTPSNMAGFDAAIEKSLDRTGVWKIKISSITGKRKKYDSDGNEMKFGRMEQNR